MKKSILTRVLAALGGVTLWMLGLCALAETFFRIPVTGWVSRLLGAQTPLAVLITLVLAILLCTFGVCCLMMLSNKRAVKRTGFVMQKGENGVIGVSVKSIEGLVQTCIRQHDAVKSAEIAVVERRDGIVILLNIQEAAGVNIPLAVGALQKQVKQYVNECTGVDVHEVRVLVENTEEVVAASPYAVKEPAVMTTAVTAAELQREAAEAAVEAAVEPVAEATPESPAAEDAVAEEPAVEAEPVAEEPAAEEILPEGTVVEAEITAAPVVQPVPVVMPAIPEMMEERDERPLHQRLFGTEDEPVFVPAPPELVIEPAAATAEPEAEDEESVEPAQEESAETAMDANAVLEVVEAIAEEPLSRAEEIASAQETEITPEENGEPAENAAEETEKPNEIINE